MVETKRCAVCSETKSISDFYKDLRNLDGKRTTCKKCVLQHTQRISLIDYDALLTLQNGGCAICGVTQEIHKKKFAVDHDHSNTSPEARGLLCSHCNTAIGLFGENTELMLNAVGYIQRHQTIIT